MNIVMLMDNLKIVLAVLLIMILIAITIRSFILAIVEIHDFIMRRRGYEKVYTHDFYGKESHYYLKKGHK